MDETTEALQQVPQSALLLKTQQKMDGGHCSFMTLLDRVVSHPYKPEHEIPDGIIITEKK